MTKFWNWRNDAKTEVRQLAIDGVIAEESWFDDDVTPKQFREELMSGSGDIEVRINSPGGDCIAASQIYTMLSEYKGKVTVKIDGLAASAASVIAMAGDVILMSATALLMIHNPSTMVFGDHNELKKGIDILEEVKESIINAYQLRTGLSRAKINRLMEEETWMNAKKAIELGFADDILKSSDDEERITAFDFSVRKTSQIVANALQAKVRNKEKNTGRTIADLKENLKKYNN